MMRTVTPMRNINLFIEVSGPVGIGKSYLLGVIRESLEKAGYTVTWRHQSLPTTNGPVVEQVLADVSGYAL